MHQSDRHIGYIREKLRGAAETLRDEDGRSLQERLHSAYLYNLSSLQAMWFPDLDAQKEFESIDAEFNRYGEMIEGAGSVPTTLFTISDDDAAELANRVLAIADRYLA